MKWFSGMNCGLACLVALFLVQTVSGRAIEPSLGRGMRLKQEVNAQLGLRDNEIVALRLSEGEQPPRQGFSVTIPFHARDFVLEMSPYSIRHPELFEVRAQQADGSWVTHNPGLIHTFRGSVSGIRGSQVAGSLGEDGLHATIILPDGGQFWIQPIGGLVRGAGALDHVVYDDRDVLPSNGVCGTLDKERVDALGGGGGPGGPLFGMGTGVFACANLGCDADFEYYQAHGSSVVTTQNDIEAIINVVDLQYQNEVSISHVITTILVRTADPDPYTATDPNALLNEMKNEWVTNQTGIVRDVAHLFTGKNLNGTTIGIAFLNVICDPAFGYGLVQSDFNGNFSCATDLSAHELGHNWSAIHCTCPGFTMNPVITCANTFSAASISDITTFASGLACLSACNGTVCGDPAAGDCFLGNGTPGCDDAACCNIVCGLDAFCCTNSWDSVCSSEAAANCGGQCCLADGTCQDMIAPDCAAAGGVFSGAGTDCATGPPCPQPCGSPTAGDCFIANGTPSCDDAACCTIVCGLDPFCCNNSWDSICAGEAATNCGGQCCLPDSTCQDLNAPDCATAGGVFAGTGTDCATGPACPQLCGSPTAGDCFVANGTPSCDNAACCNAVCAFDPFCCNSQWDSICANEAAANCAPNDFCVNAITVQAGDMLTGNLTNASNDGSAACGSSATNNDVWYVFTAPCTGTLLANTCGTHDAPGPDAGMDTVLSVHSGCPGDTLNQLDCNDDWPFGSDPAACTGSDAGVNRDSAVAVALTPGQTVWIRVTHFGVAIADGAFMLNIDFQFTAPANDDCVNALPIINGQTPFDTDCANTNGLAPCGLMGSDIWYVYTAVFSGNVTVDTCMGSTFDTVLAAYDGVCPTDPPTNLIVCNDDFCSLSSSISFPVVVGQDYLIQVGGLGGGQGTGTITITKSDFACGDPASGSCYVANGTPSCDDATCCNNVCAVDVFCCDVQWDSICADEAAFFCPSSCVGDVTPPGGNQVVNIDDLVAVLNAFGSCFQCPEDITPPPTGNGVVNIDDLVAVLNAFGSCAPLADCTTPGTCATGFVNCDPANPNCVCATAFDGTGICIDGNLTCATLGLCPTGTCPVGEVCVTLTCCFDNVCVPESSLCFTGLAATEPVDLPPGTRTISGVVGER